METFVQEERDAGNEVLPWKWKQYEGWHVGAVTVGERTDSLFCQLSGQTAGLGWLSLLERPVNVTRLDIQVTIRDAPAEVDLAAEGFRDLEARGDDMGRRRTYSLITTRPMGSTLYLGAAASDSRLRLYDKAAESRGSYSVGAWRYEYQARSSVAGALAAGLVDCDGSGVTGQSTVHQRFSASGVQPRFRAGGRGVLAVVPRTRSDAQRKLKWLDAQVRPTLNWLRSNGYGRDAIRALGVDVAHQE
jgi:DNA relaxase NicK